MKNNKYLGLAFTGISKYDPLYFAIACYNVNQ